MSTRNLMIGAATSRSLIALMRLRKGPINRLENAPILVASACERMISTKVTTRATKIARPRNPVAAWLSPLTPNKVTVTTPHTGNNNVTNVLHMPTAVIAAVAPVAGTPKVLSIPNCTASPTAPPPGTPLLMANAAWLSCCDRQYFKPGVAALNGNP